MSEFVSKCLISGQPIEEGEEIYAVCFRDRNKSLWDVWTEIGAYKSNLENGVEDLSDIGVSISLKEISELIDKGTLFEFLENLKFDDGLIDLSEKEMMRMDISYSSSAKLSKVLLRKGFYNGFNWMEDVEKPALFVLRESESMNWFLVKKSVVEHLGLDQDLGDFPDLSLILNITSIAYRLRREITQIDRPICGNSYVQSSDLDLLKQVSLMNVDYVNQRELEFEY